MDRPPAPSSVAVARVVVAAAISVTGVVDLHAGAVGEFATYGPGQRVPGVRVRLSQRRMAATVRIVAAYGQPLGSLAAEVRRRVREEVHRQLGDDITVDVHIADVRTADGLTEGPGP